jgi:excisionase family DNA binding protein
MSARDYTIDLLTVTQAMKMTGRSKRTIDRWIKDGRLHSVDLGGFDGVVLDRGEVARCEKQMRDNQSATRQTDHSAAA